MLKTLLLGSVVITLSACSSLQTSTKEVSGDPQIIQGENWTFIENEPFAAIRQAEQKGFRWGKGAIIPTY